MAYDPKSPLTQILQTKGWPLKYKPQNLPRYDGNIDPRQFVMSYEDTIATAGEDKFTMEKSFVIIARDIAQAWYSNLSPSSIDSWGNLREKLCNHFKGINPSSTNPMEVFTCIQAEREPLQDF
jgi:hypothetical protein